MITRNLMNSSIIQQTNTAEVFNNVEKTLMASETVLWVSDMNLLTLDTNWR